MNPARDPRSSLLALLALTSSLAACGSNGNSSGSDGGDQDAMALDAEPSDGLSDAQRGTLVVTFDATTRVTTVYGRCADADMLVVAPLETTVGRQISLEASGLSPNLTRADVRITWAVVGTAGSLSSTSGSSNVFNCTSRGSSTLTATAWLDGGASCDDGGSLSAVVTCD